MLSEEQTHQLKKQIISQIDSNFPEDKKTTAKEKIQNMGAEKLKKFLEENQLNQNQQSPFRSIVEGKIQSYKIAENSSAMAVLEINPISEGHTIVIPKSSIQDPKNMTPEILKFSEDLGKKLQEKLNPKKVSVLASSVFGETIINLLPIYNNENLDSPRNSAKKEDLEKIQTKLLEDIKEKSSSKEDSSVKPEIEKVDEKNTWLPKRKP